jgi:hypothetical protein
VPPLGFIAVVLLFIQFAVRVINFKLVPTNNPIQYGSAFAKLFQRLYVG